MVYEKHRVLTAVTADEVPERTILQGLYGYFAHDVNSLKRAVIEEKTSSRCYYGRLTQIKDDTNRARFVLDKGELIFTLFYPTDTALNVNRY